LLVPASTQSFRQLTPPDGVLNQRGFQAPAGRPNLACVYRRLVSELSDLAPADKPLQYLLLPVLSDKC
jgi:hypothetical protein